MEPISVVIDKSFLQNHKPEQLSGIIEKGCRLLLTAELASEIFTTNNSEFKKCFGGLLAFRDYIDIIEHLGALFKVEIENGVSCSPISTYFLKGILNKNFNYKFNENQVERIKEFEYDTEISGSQEFEKVVLEIRKFFPEITIKDIQSPEVIRRIYARLRDEKMPSAEKIDESWAIFRRLQVDCMAAIEYAFSFKNGKFDITEERKRHNQIDFRIIILALLAKGVASNDRLIRRYFKVLCPDGVFFPMDK